MTYLSNSYAYTNATCSHVWKDVRYINQFVYNLEVAPWDMERGQVYQCVNCRIRLYPHATGGLPK